MFNSYGILKGAHYVHTINMPTTSYSVSEGWHAFIVKFIAIKNVLLCISMKLRWPILYPTLCMYSPGVTYRNYILAADAPVA